jgi:hypothetical protein
MDNLIKIPDKWLFSFETNQNEGVLLSIRNDTSEILKINAQKGIINISVLFTAREKPVELKGIINQNSLNTIIIVNTLNRIALYINNKLYDEDWPLGKVNLENCFYDICNGKAEFCNEFSKEPIQDCEKKYLYNINNWTPEGINTGAGDCMPFSHDGIYHLFYLFDRRSHGSKWGFGAHQWAHISSSDLIKWTVHPMTVSIDEQIEASICTGSVFYNEGSFYAFYAVRMSDYSPARLTYAISEDCIVFKKSGNYVNLTEPYEPVSARDPKIFKSGDGLFHMLVTSSYGKDKLGCLAHLTSEDLSNWKQEEPFLLLDIKDQPECSDYFYLNGWYYLIFSNYGFAHYRISKAPYGPWITPENDMLGEEGLRVPKTALFNNRIILAGFKVPSDRGYAGKVVFLEAIQNNEDGTLTYVNVPSSLFCIASRNTTLPA